jgi:hypothetical protein
MSSGDGVRESRRNERVQYPDLTKLVKPAFAIQCTVNISHTVTEYKIGSGSIITESKQT